MSHEHEHEHSCHTHACCGCHHNHEHERGKGDVRRELTGVFLGVGFFAAALLMAYFELLFWVEFTLYIAAYLVLGGNVLLDAVKSIFHGELFNENVLMSIATIGAFVIGDYPEAVGVMLFFRVGEYCEHLASRRSRNAVMQAVDMRPETVIVLRGETEEVLPAEEARVGDTLLVRAGDRIPLDGTVTSGHSRIDTAPITGESVPVSVSEGTAVLSGCINLDGILTLCVDKALQDSIVTRIVRSVESAAARKPKTERFIAKFARIYTPLVVITAVLTATIPPLLFHGDWSHWIYMALTFLVISCPCALVLSVPLAFFSGIGAGSRKGILFKDGAALEALASVQAVVMDKTGTLTEGVFSVRRCKPAEGVNENELLRLCAAAEHHSTHPIGVSIVAEARARGLVFDTPTGVTERAGMGVCAVVGGKTVLCGNRKLMAEEKVLCPKGKPDETEVLVSVDGCYYGRITVADAPKLDAAAALSDIHRAGLYTVMMTGDTAKNAEQVARALHIDETHAELLPENKLEALEKVRYTHGAVLFVGDGINDTPVLAGADVGAAMGSGADAAIEAADVVYMTNAVSAIPCSRHIARHAVAVARQNVWFALAVKFAVMIVSFFGMATMWWAVFADTGVALLCVLNSVRVLYKKW